MGRKKFWAKIDLESREAHRGTWSLPVDASGNKHIEAKIVNNRGMESLKVLEIK